MRLGKDEREKNNTENKKKKNEGVKEGGKSVRENAIRILLWYSSIDEKEDKYYLSYFCPKAV